MIISSDSEHYCYIIYPVKIILLRNWEACRSQSLAVPAPRTLFNKTGNVRTAWHCGAMVQPLLQWKSNKHFIFWMCVCSLRHPASACAILSSVPCPALPHSSTLSHKRHDFRGGGGGGKVIEHEMCLDFLYVSFLTHFSFYEEFGKIRSKMCIGLHIKCPLIMSHFQENRIFPTDFRKILKCQISWKSVQRESSCSMRRDGRTNERIKDEANNRSSRFCERA